uniref:Uncharacterized protein n=1 Tax=Cucumis sativus TaxID=3659 RepID=A0A0A0LY67_CUCSA
MGKVPDIIVHVPSVSFLCLEDDLFCLTIKMLVREEAFTRIAPAISGVADRSTVHNLFKALAGDEQSISLSLWLKYVDELLKVHEGRKLYRVRDNTQFFGENILCVGSSKKRPVLKWENNIAWPGKITLTDKAVYFEVLITFQLKLDF